MINCPHKDPLHFTKYFYKFCFSTVSKLEHIVGSISQRRGRFLTPVRPCMYLQQTAGAIREHMWACALMFCQVLREKCVREYRGRCMQVYTYPHPYAHYGAHYLILYSLNKLRFFVLMHHNHKLRIARQPPRFSFDRGRFVIGCHCGKVC